MKIEAYIEKHGLTLRTPSKDEDAWMTDYGMPHDHEATYYASDDAKHVVVIDKTAGTFRVVHEEPVRVQTDWLDCRTNYETDVRPFW